MQRRRESIDTCMPGNYTGACQWIYSGPAVLYMIACQRYGAITFHGRVLMVKERGVEEGYGERRAALERRFRALPPAGSASYWRAIEYVSPADALPLEVLGLCLRERLAAGAHDDADRIFTVILQRIQSRVQRWAQCIAGQSRRGKGLQIAQDLEQECYLALWKELVDDGPTFLLENFLHTLGRIEQHVAHDVMQKEGEWIRPSVAHPTRVPRRETESIEAHVQAAEGMSVAYQFSDPAADRAFEQAEISDLPDLLGKLQPEERCLIYDVYWRGLTQQEIAGQLSVADRTVRNRLLRALGHLRRLYLGSEEDDRG